MGLASVGNDGQDVPSRQEVMQILNDPNVGMAVKRQLALEYVDYVEDESPESCGFTNEADRNGFRDYLKSLHNDWITEGDIDGNNGGLSDVRDAYKEAKDEYDKSQEKGRRSDRDALNGGAAALQNITDQSSDTNPGAPTSDDILNTGVSALKVFEVFLPLVSRAVAVNGGGAVIQFGEIQRLYFEQKGIPFTKFKAEADEFTALHGAIVNSANDVAGKLRGSLADWEGAAADQAHRFQKGYTEKTTAVAEAVNGAADGLLHTIGSVGKSLRDKANWVQKYYFDKWGDVTAQDIDRLLRVAELGDGASQNDFIHCISFMDMDSKDAYNDDIGSLDEDTIVFLTGQAKKWLNDPFCKWFDMHIKNFQLMCSNTKTAVDAAWSVYSELLNKVSENPYADVGKAPEDGKPQDRGDGGQGGGKNGSGSNGNGSGSGGNGPGGTAIPKPMEPPKPPEVPKSEVPDPNLNPVTHKPVATDPDTGRPYPIDPVTGAPITGAVPDRDTMTVQHGANKISMVEPGQDGKMGISVDDGTGLPKDYKLDFGDGKVHPLPDATPDHGPQGAIHHDMAQGTDGPGGKSYQPGPDDKIHIEDGTFKITAERPDGPGGETVITVDDGKGDPAKYTLGEHEAKDGPTTVHDTGAVPQGNPPSQADGGRHGAAAEVRHADVGQQLDPATRLHEAAAGGSGAGAHAVSSPEGAGQPVASHAEPLAASTGAGAGESTSAQSFSDIFSGAGLFGGDSAAPGAADGGLGDTAFAGTDVSGGSSPQSGSGLGSAPGGADTTPGAGPGGTGMMGGTMGGMGGAAGGGGTEEQQRASSSYRVDGGLFDTAAAGGRISGSLDDDSASGSR
jgi:hypothetical protein